MSLPRQHGNNSGGGASSAQIADFYRRDQLFQIEDRLNQLSAHRQNNNNNTQNYYAPNATPMPHNNNNNNNNTSMLSATNNNTSFTSNNNNNNINNTSVLSFGSGASPLPQQPPTGEGTSNLYLGRRSPTLEPGQPPSYVSVPLGSGGFLSNNNNNDNNNNLTSTPAPGNRPLSRKEAAAARVRQNQEANAQNQSENSAAKQGVSTFAEYQQEVAKMGGQVLPIHNNNNNNNDNKSVSHLEKAIQDRTRLEKEKQQQKEQEEKAALFDASNLQQQQHAHVQPQQLRPENLNAAALANANYPPAAAPTTTNNTTSSLVAAQQLVAASPSPMVQQSNVAVAGDVDFRRNTSNPQQQQQQNHQQNQDALGEFGRQPSLAVDFENPQGVGAGPRLTDAVPHPTNHVLEILQNQLISNPTLISEQQQMPNPAGQKDASAVVVAPFPIQHDLDIMMKTNSNSPPPKQPQQQQQQQTNQVIPRIPLDTLNQSPQVQIQQQQQNNNNTASSPPKDNLTRMMEQALGYGSQQPTPRSSTSSHNQKNAAPLQITHQDFLASQKQEGSTTPLSSPPQIRRSTSQSQNQQEIQQNFVASPIPPIPGMPVFLNNNNNNNDRRSESLSRNNDSTFFNNNNNNNNNVITNQNLSLLNMNSSQQQQQNQFIRPQVNDASSSVAGATGYPTPGLARSELASVKNGGSTTGSQQGYYHPSGPFAFGRVPQPTDTKSNASNKEFAKEQTKQQLLTRQMENIRRGSNASSTNQSTQQEVRDEEYINHLRSNPAKAQQLANQMRAMEKQIYGRDFLQPEQEQFLAAIGASENNNNNNINNDHDALVKETSTFQTTQAIPPDPRFNTNPNSPTYSGANTNNSKTNIFLEPRRNSGNQQQLQGDQLMNTMQLVALNSADNESGANFREQEVEMFKQRQLVASSQVVNNETSRQLPSQALNAFNNNSNMNNIVPPLQQQQREMTTPSAAVPHYQNIHSDAIPTNLVQNHHDPIIPLPPSSGAPPNASMASINQASDELASMYRQHGEQSSPGRLIRRLHESERQRLALAREVDALKTDLKEAIEQQARMAHLPGNIATNALLQAQQKQHEREQNKINASRFDPSNTNENVIVRVRSTDAAEGEGAQWAAEIDEEEQARTRAQQVMTEMLRAIDSRKGAEVRLQAVNAENERLRNQAREAQKREAQLHQMLTQYQDAFNSWRSTWNDQNALQSSGVANGLGGGGGGGGSEGNDVVLGRSQGLSSVRVQILESRVEALTKENEKLRSEGNVQAAKRKAQEEAEAARMALRGRGVASELNVTSTASAAALRRRGADQDTEILVRMFELQRQNEGLQHNINEMKLQQRRSY